LCALFEFASGRIRHAVFPQRYEESTPSPLRMLSSNPETALLYAAQVTENALAVLDAAGLSHVGRSANPFAAQDVRMDVRMKLLPSPCCSCKSG
jgi:hypothetical protein